MRWNGRRRLENSTKKRIGCMFRAMFRSAPRELRRDWQISTSSAATTGFASRKCPAKSYDRRDVVSSTKSANFIHLNPRVGGVRPSATLAINETCARLKEQGRKIY